MDTHFPRDDVQLRLESENDLRATRGSGLCAGNLVGVSTISIAANRRHSVHAGKASSAENRHLGIRFLRPVSSAAEINRGLYRGESSVCFNPGSERNNSRMPMSS